MQKSLKSPNQCVQEISLLSGNALPTPSKDYTSSCRKKFKLSFPGKILECSSEGKDFHSSQKLFVVDVWPQKGPWGEWFTLYERLHTHITYYWYIQVACFYQGSKQKVTSCRIQTKTIAVWFPSHHVPPLFLFLSSKQCYLTFLSRQIWGKPATIH